MREQNASENIIKTLETGLDRAIKSYQSILSEDIPPDPKGFTAYHNACKAALMHIALATKITESLSPKETDDQTDWVKLAKDALKTEDDDEVIFS